MAMSPSGRQVAVACPGSNRRTFSTSPRASPVLSSAAMPRRSPLWPTAPTGRACHRGRGRHDPLVGPDDRAGARGARGPPGRVQLAYSADGRRIAAAMDDQNVLWDTADGRLVGSLGRNGFEHKADIRRLPRFGPDGRLVISGRLGELCQWEAATGKLVAVLGDFESPLKLVALSPDGKRVAAAGAEEPPSFIHLWDRDSGKVRESCMATRTISGFWTSARTGRDCSRRATTRIAHRASGTRQTAGSSLSSPATRIASSWPHSARTAGAICTAFMDTTARLWDAHTGKLVAVLGGHTGLLQSVRFGPDGRRWSPRRRMPRSDFGTPGQVNSTAVLRGHGGLGDQFAVEPLFTPDGSVLVSGIAGWNHAPLGPGARGAQWHAPRPRGLRLRRRLQP